MNKKDNKKIKNKKEKVEKIKKDKKNKKEIDSISFKKKGKYSFLEVILDKVGGIDIDEIVTATHIINPIVDKYCDIDDSYILDISSKERGN